MKKENIVPEREEEVRLKREWEQGLFLARLEAEKTAQFPGDPTPLGSKLRFLLLET